MIEQKYFELINQEIDGVNSATESAKLKSYLSRHVEARKLYHELVSAANMLREIKEVEPSPNLKKSILHSIQHNRYSAKEKISAWSGIKNLAHALFGSPSYQLKYAYAFALGLMAGLFIYVVLRGASSQQVTIDDTDLYGTMLPRPSEDRLETASSAKIILPQGEGEILLKSSPQTVLAELSLKTPQEIEVEIQFEATGLSYRSITRLNSDAGNSISAGENVIKLTHAGYNEYVFTFARKAPPVASLTFRIFFEGSLVYGKTLSTQKKLG